MAEANFITPKLWKPGEVYDPADFNNYLANNMEALYWRQSFVRERVPGAGDYTWTNTTLAPHPSTIERGGLFVQAPGKVQFWVNMSLQNTVAGAQIFFDFFWINEGVYISTLTDTPAPHGLFQLDIRNLSSWENLYCSWVEYIPEGNHVFELYVATSTGTATQNGTDSRTGWGFLYL